MKATFIIIARSDTECDVALKSLESLIWTPGEFEVLLALGTNPSLQRNEAVKAAKGDYVVFLDNDSAADPRLLHYFFEALEYEDGIGVVGGPSIYAEEKDLFKKAVQSVFTSVFGLGPFRSRYMASGQVRRTGEHELILCNMMVKRELFLEERGFNIDLYPNEENEFLNRVRKRTKIYYHPLAACYRDPRDNLRELVQQMISYGEGRARHLCMFPRFWNHIFLIPIGFFAYVALLPFALTLTSPQFSALYFLPFLVYALFSFSASAFAAIGRRDLRLTLAMPLLFLISHLCYGFGLLSGLIKHPFLSRQRPAGNVKIIPVLNISGKRRVEYG